MRDAIERALSAVIGLPLRYAARAGNMATFGFGDEHEVPDELRGGTKTVATYRLHVQCASRIVGPTGIVAASRDMYYWAGLWRKPARLSWCGRRSGSLRRSRQTATPA